MHLPIAQQPHCSGVLLHWKLHDWYRGTVGLFLTLMTYGENLQEWRTVTTTTWRSMCVKPCGRSWAGRTPRTPEGHRRDTVFLFCCPQGPKKLNFPTLSGVTHCSRTSFPCCSSQPKFEINNYLVHNIEPRMVGCPQELIILLVWSLLGLDEYIKMEI